MPLAPGTKLGPYEILAPLGAGGMGEVYRARDTRLGRDVALKILPKEMSTDAARKQRFEREARTISSLNHPHICTLHDIGSQDGTDYLVMECVEGETLAKRLEKGPLPLDQVLKYGAQIADALDKAHRAGIVHRDLKPGNIMLTASGAKLLDFGLAKPAAPLVSGATLTAATPTTPVTQEGTVVGTFQYMSPEQVEGNGVDSRSDIFSLGAVLYEMVTGKKAFEGKSQLSVASSILEKEPTSISSIKPLTPPTLDHAIRRCLSKDPEDRWQTARDLELELKWIAEAGSQAETLARVIRPKGLQHWLPWVVALAAAFIATLLTIVHFSRSTPEAKVVSSTILPPEGGAFVFNGPVGGAFLSPDGSSVAFIARVGKVTQLWVRPLNSFSARALPGTEDTSFAFWSPDSHNLGFFAQGKLKRIPVAGGPPQTLCDADSERGASWGRSDVILFARVNGEIQRIPASGGTPERVTKLDLSRHEGTHRWPYFLPDGNHFLFMAALLGPVSEDNVFYLGSLDGKPSRILAHGSSPIRYASGYALYLVGATLIARPFDTAKLDFTGEPVSIAEGVQSDPMFSNAIFAVSENGLLLYQLGKGSNAHSLLLFDRTGKRLGSIGESSAGSGPRFSPDAKALLYDLASPNLGKLDLWLMDLGSGNRTRLTTDALNLAAHFAVWSPDGTQAAYTSLRTGTPGIWIKTLNRITPEKERWEASDDNFIAATDWTADGKYLVLTERPTRTGAFRISLLSIAGKDGPEQLLEVQGANLSAGQVSRDGRWIAYTSTESGRNEIYISSFPKATGKLQVSVAGGLNPRWKGDGKELYYLAETTLMAVELKGSGGSLQVGAIRSLFEIPQTRFLTATLGLSMYNVTADGNRFVMDSVLTEESATPLNLVTNWTSELKAK